jgi:ABC-type branched-subunit amino acid transport system substrate-binding protein
VAAKSAYTIGYLLSLSGQAAFVGQEAVTGANFAISEINKAAGVNGHPIKGNFQIINPAGGWNRKSSR